MPQKYKRFIPIIAVVLVALGVNLDQFGIDLRELAGGASQTTSSSSSGNSSQSANSHGSAHADYAQWSKTTPEINLWHVFEGEINSRGKPTGFHSRPGGQDPANARVLSVRDGPNGRGIYTANIEVRDGNNWKQKFSSFFPDDLTQQQVIDVILHAYKNSKNPDGQPWEGPSGQGYQVQGYTSSRGGINTAFPIYTR